MGELHDEDLGTVLHCFECLAGNFPIDGAECVVIRSIAVHESFACLGAGESSGDCHAAYGEAGLGDWNERYNFGGVSVVVEVVRRQ